MAATPQAWRQGEIQDMPAGGAFKGAATSLFGVAQRACGRARSSGKGAVVECLQATRGGSSVQTTTTTIVQRHRGGRGLFEGRHLYKPNAVAMVHRLVMGEGWQQNEGDQIGR